MQEVEQTEVVAERPEPEERSIRSSLRENLRNITKFRGEEDESGRLLEKDDTEVETSDETEQPSVVPVEQPQAAASTDVVPMVPPADMRQEEREAFLNPTPQNAHILQGYVNRRAYESRSEFQRRMVELEALRNETKDIHEVMNEYKDYYAKHGYRVSDMARRAMAFDKSMHDDPVKTAREWLQSYGLSPEDLGAVAGQATEQAPVAQKYLTKEEAERIAEEKYRAVQNEQQQKAVEYYNTKIVESFVSSKPLFRDPETASQLEAEMAPIVAAFTQTGQYSSPEEILEKAYNYVVQGNPTFSGIHQRITAKAQVDMKQAVAQKAKAAAKSISGSAGSGSPRLVTNDIRDNLRRRLSGGE